MIQFECDVDPDTGWPRVRFNFTNGWSASLLMRTSRRGMDAMIASVACAPTGKWGQGQTELGPTEAFADEAIAWIEAVSTRPNLQDVAA